jgi:hypothetical protein
LQNVAIDPDRARSQFFKIDDCSQRTADQALDLAAEMGLRLKNEFLKLQLMHAYEVRMAWVRRKLFHLAAM